MNTASDSTTPRRLTIHADDATHRVPFGGCTPFDVDAVMDRWYDTDPVGIERRRLKRGSLPRIGHATNPGTFTLKRWGRSPRAA